MLTSDVLLVETDSAIEGTSYEAKAQDFEGYEATAKDTDVLIKEGVSPIDIAYIPTTVDLDKLTVQQLKSYLDFKDIKYGSKDTKETLLALAGGA